MTAPRLFALTRETEGPSDAIVGYGLVLPDGSAIAVSWPKAPGASIYSTPTAEDCAALRAAELKWLSDQQ